MQIKKKLGATFLYCQSFDFYNKLSIKVKKFNNVMKELDIFKV